MTTGTPKSTGSPMTAAPVTVPGHAVLTARIGSFTFHGDTDPALRDVEVSVRPGTLTAVLGGSGSGKTALGKLLAGWLRPGQSGALTGALGLAGELLEFHGGQDDPRINPAAWAARVGYVPQDAAAMLTTVRSTVAEEVAFGLENRGTARPDMLREVARIAELTGLAALLGRDPATLSGGELRRLAIACAVVTDPDVLVLDEPLASLDAAGIVQVRDLISRLTGTGTAVVVLSQAADGLARSAAHWLVLDGGTATAGGPPRQLIRSAELARTGTVIHTVTHTAAARTVIQTPVIQAPAAVRDAGHKAGPGHAPQSPPESQPAPALELSSVGFSFPPGHAAAGEPVLRNLCLAVQPGEIVAVTGRNGAGKSTLLRHLNGLL
ncbi:MAG TPA: ATP-binding cassette domain-containing protein, partial [Arthrobacter sp.]